MTEYIDPGEMWIDDGEYILSRVGLTYENRNPVKIKKTYYARALAYLFEERADIKTDEEPWLVLYWAFKKTFRRINKRFSLYSKLTGGVWGEIGTLYAKSILVKELCKEFARIENLIDERHTNKEKWGEWIETKVIGYWKAAESKEESK